MNFAKNSGRLCKVLCRNRFSGRKFSTESGGDASQTADQLPSTTALEGSPTASFVPRERFEIPQRFQAAHWYPRHMSIQLKRMEGKLRTVDLIIEVHDARVAITGRNPIFAEKLFSVRPHILVLNKMDLINLRKYRVDVENYYRERGVENIIWTNCKKRGAKALNELQKVMISCLQNEHRFNRTVKNEYQVMVTGIPNVGKSSLINSMRLNNLGLRNAAVKEGARPGVTIRVQNRVRFNDHPPIYVLDTPGVLNPFYKSVEGGMKLALCNLILESATKPYYVADYLLYFMNSIGDHSYVSLLGMEYGPTNDIRRVLLHICQQNNLQVPTYIGGRKEMRWDFHGATKWFIRLYRNHEIADAFLDRDLL